MNRFQENLRVAHETLDDLRRFDDLARVELKALGEEKNVMINTTRAFSKALDALKSDRETIKEKLLRTKPDSNAYLLAQAELRRCDAHAKIAEKAWHSGKQKILKLISTIQSTNESNVQTRRAIANTLASLSRHINTSAQDSRKVLLEQVMETEPVKQLCAVSKELSEWDSKKRSIVSDVSKPKRARHAPMSVRWHKGQKKFQLHVSGRHRGYFGTMASAWTHTTHLLKMPVSVLECSLTGQKGQ